MSSASEILPVITLHKGVPVATSMQVAEHFEKQHKDVLRAIRNAVSDIPDEEYRERNFALSYKINELANNRQDPYYLLTREGFLILGMGFTGQKAMAMKIAFIKAFTAMEREILSLRGNANQVDECGLTWAAKRLPVRQKVQLMSNATQIAKGEDRLREVKEIYADLCNTIAGGSVPWAELVLAKGEESVRLFVEQCCEASDNPQRRVLLTVFYAAYASWCGVAEGGFAPVSQNRFTELLRKFAPGSRISRPRAGAPKHRPLSVSGLVLHKSLGLF